MMSKLKDASALDVYPAPSHHPTTPEKLTNPLRSLGNEPFKVVRYAFKENFCSCLCLPSRQQRKTAPVDAKSSLFRDTNDKHKSCLSLLKWREKTWWYSIHLSYSNAKQLSYIRLCSYVKPPPPTPHTYPNHHHHYHPMHYSIPRPCLGWSGGAMVLGKLPVPWRPTNLDFSRTRAYSACSRCGWGWFGHFSLIYHFSLLSPSLWDLARYKTEILPQRAVKPQKKQPTKIQLFI